MIDGVATGHKGFTCAFGEVLVGNGGLWMPVLGFLLNPRTD